MRMLSNLCSLTYYMHSKVTPEALMRRHQLELVTTSLACERGLRLDAIRSSQVRALLSDGDAMAGDALDIATSYGKLLQGQVPEEASAPLTALAAVAKVGPITKERVMKKAGAADVVGSSLAAAAAAAAFAANSVYSAAVPYATPLANNITSFTMSFTGNTPLRSLATQLQSAAAAGQSSAVATVATVAAAISAQRKDSPSPSPKDVHSPSAWIVADEPSSSTRFFVIQGSDNLDHWRINLSFDPIVFEDPSLGVTVHRGVYETALLLYERFLPLVRDHLASCPNGKVAFTGHSLGGSLGTLLLAMFVHRGVVPINSVAPTYTFGAPAVLCDMRCDIPGMKKPAATGKECDHDAILSKFGLPRSSVINVQMHKDIVPRAFACDYALVADLLKRVGEGFRTQACLSGEKVQLFNHVGNVYVLQPEEEMSFVSDEGFHPLLPQRPGLYRVVQPDSAMLEGGAPGLASSPPVTNLSVATAAAVLVPKPPSSLSDIVWEMMNTPHPLDVLSEAGAYGDAGSISRYHNPDNYTRALGGLLRAAGPRGRKLIERAAQIGMRYYMPVMGGAAPASDSK